jgi:hypothetical protein
MTVGLKRKSLNGFGSVSEYCSNGKDLEKSPGNSSKWSPVALLLGGPVLRSRVGETDLRQRALQVGIQNVSEGLYCQCVCVGDDPSY